MAGACRARLSAPAVRRCLTRRVFMDRSLPGIRLLELGVPRFLTRLRCEIPGSTRGGRPEGRRFRYDHRRSSRLQRKKASMPAAAVKADLIDRCLAGDRQAWDELHRRSRPQALAFLRRLGVGPREAEDVCQEVFLQIVRYLPRFERRADFSTWLYKLCISQAGRLRRRAALLRPLSWLG